MGEGIFQSARETYGFQCNRVQNFPILSSTMLITSKKLPVAEFYSNNVHILFLSGKANTLLFSNHISDRVFTEIVKFKWGPSAGLNSFWLVSIWEGETKVPAWREREETGRIRWCSQPTRVAWVQSSLAALWRNQPCHTLTADFSLRTVPQQISVSAHQRVMLCYDSPSKWMQQPRWSFSYYPVQGPPSWSKSKLSLACGPPAPGAVSRPHGEWLCLQLWASAVSDLTKPLSTGPYSLLQEILAREIRL